MNMRNTQIASIALLYAILLTPPQATEPTPQVIDDFSAAEAWTATGTDEVGAGLRWVDGPGGKALCLDYDFSRASGFATARRVLPLQLPADYEFRFSLRGEGGPNHLQFKLVDASGENVWWVSRPEFSPSDDWQPQRFKKRHVDFAWGPTRERTLRESASIEWVVAAGSGGGRGHVCIDPIRLIERLPAGVAPVPVLSSSTGTTRKALARALDGSDASAWHSRNAKPQSLTLDLGQTREFGGVVLRWLPKLGARHYRLSLSDDGRQWRGAREVVDGDGGVDPLQLRESEARYLRIDLLQPQGSHYALAELQLRELEFGASPNAMIQALAKESARGDYPRGFSAEQTYWTVLGVNGGRAQALMSEDGAIEPHRGAFSLEPLLFMEGRRLSWADAAIAHTLQDGDLPIPTVHWLLPEQLRLDITAFADGPPERPRLLARYALRNTGTAARTLTLALAVRPLQVNPPVQFLNTPGGVSAIRTLDISPQRVRVNGADAVWPLTPADAIAARGFDQGALLDWLPSVVRHGHSMPSAQMIDDPAALASGAMLYHVTLAPGAQWETGVVLPMIGGAADAPDRAGATPASWLQARQDEVTRHWRGVLDTARVDVGAAPELGAAMRTALAHILINRDGPSIQPGTRSYARSWIRDGAMTSGALMRLGHAQVAREFLDWFLPFQFDNGKVPCCADKRGADPVAENDSHGELIHLIAELHRYDQDHDGLRRRWPAVVAAVRYMDQLRASERVATNQSDERRAYYGLLPPSISHEGYSDRPAYSYWDGFWGLLGYKDAVAIAQALDDDAEAQRIAAAGDEYRKDLYASLIAAMAKHHIDFIPGAADRGDFDATSTTIALAPGGEQQALPAAALNATFERYWNHFLARRDGRSDSTAYTPYEWRVVGSFVRLGWKQRAMQALDYFMADRRPLAWNQWGEVVGHKLREPRFIGDMPHGWVASDFIRSALDLFVYERESDRSLVLAAGVPEAWRGGEGVSVQSVRTPYGALSYRLGQNASGEIRLQIDAGTDIPPGGIRWLMPDSVLIDAPAAGLTRVGEEWVMTSLPQILRVKRKQ
jgi:hypothetical protein